MSRPRFRTQPFSPPAPTKTIAFNALSLSAAFGRVSALAGAPRVLLLAERLSMHFQALVLIKNGSPFQLADSFGYLRDDGRSAFAARFGAAVTDIYMSSMRYAWRDNAQCIAPASDPHGDFLYAGGPVGSSGVVLAEAHGSFAKDASAALIRRRAMEKYTAQVAIHLGVTSPHGDVMHGYSVAFGSSPLLAGAFLALAETEHPRVANGPHPVPPRRGVRASLALATHRANFQMMNATAVVRATDAVRMGRTPKNAEQVFVRVQQEGRSVLFASGWSKDTPVDIPCFGVAGNSSVTGRPVNKPIAFGMLECSARSFLEWLSEAAVGTGAGEPPFLDPSEVLELPEVEPIGLSSEGESERGRLAVFPDGFVAVHPGDYFQGAEISRLRWSPRDGLSDVPFS